MDEELRRLLTQAKAQVDRLPPAERSSLYACNVLNRVIAETVASAYEDPGDQAELIHNARMSLEKFIDGLYGGTDVFMMAPGLGTCIWRLTDKDRRYMIGEARKAIRNLR